MSGENREPSHVGVASVGGGCGVFGPVGAEAVASLGVVPDASLQHLDETEIQALLDAPDLDTRTGRRDRAILLLLVQTGLRVGELIGLDRGSISLDGQASVVCRGKGRKDRSTPLRQDTVQVLGEWMRERPAGDGDPLFVSNLNRRLSSDSAQRLVRKHVQACRAGGQAMPVTRHGSRHSTCRGPHVGTRPKQGAAIGRSETEFDAVEATGFRYNARDRRHMRADGA